MTNSLTMTSARQIKRAQVRALNEPPRLTVGEEVFNAATHGLGAALSAAGLEPELSVAPRDSLSPCHTVTRRCVCRK